MTLAVYLVEDAEKTWVIAADEDDAFAVYQETYPSAIETKEDLKITRLPDDDEITIVGEEDERETRTLAEWTKEGRGFLAATWL